MIWGSGTPRREFLHVDDMAAACAHVMELPHATHAAHTSPMCSHINVGTGDDITIRKLAETIARVTEFERRLTFDTSRPDGAPRKLLDVHRLQKLNWVPNIRLSEGLRDTFEWYRENLNRRGDL